MPLCGHVGRAAWRALKILPLVKKKGSFLHVIRLWYFWQSGGSVALTLPSHWRAASRSDFGWETLQGEAGAALQSWEILVPFVAQLENPSLASRGGLAFPSLVFPALK